MLSIGNLQLLYAPDFLIEEIFPFDASSSLEQQPQHLCIAFASLCGPSCPSAASNGPYPFGLPAAERPSGPSRLALPSSDGVMVEGTCYHTGVLSTSLLVLFKDPSSADFDLLQRPVFCSCLH